MMKRYALIALLVLSMPIAAQNPFGPRPQPVKAAPEKIFDKVDEIALFPGGPEAMQKYLADNMSRPNVMRGLCSSRRLIAGFVIEKDGSLTQIEIIKSINGCPDFDFDVLRVIKNMPKWEPAKVKGRWVRSYYKMPVYIE